MSDSPYKALTEALRGIPNTIDPDAPRPRHPYTGCMTIPEISDEEALAYADLRKGTRPPR